MREFMTRGGAVSVDHLNELHRAADDLTGERRDVPPMGHVGPQASAGESTDPARCVVHAGAGTAATGAVKGFLANLTPEQQTAALAYRGKDTALPSVQRDDAEAFLAMAAQWWPDHIAETDHLLATAAERIASTYAAARVAIAAANSLPFASPEPYREPDARYRKRLGLMRAGLEGVEDRDLDAAGRSLGLPRARLVLVEE